MSSFANTPHLTLSELDINLANGTLALKANPSSLPVLIVAYANYCGYCHRFAPLFQQIERVVQGAVLTRVFHGPDEPLLKSLLNVQGYPTVLMLDRRGAIHVFENERTFETLLSFIKSHSS